MSRIFVHGHGAVSPAGWGVGPLRDAIAKGTPLPGKPLARPGWDKPVTIRQVPLPEPRPAFLAQPRLRRTSPISHYVVAAAIEAIGGDAPLIAAGNFRLGIVLCAMSGCVNYSRRFYDETLRDPATASPLVFPETVFNAPASHLAAVLCAPTINYTLVGDPGTYLQGLALAAHWLLEDRVDACVVVGGEESDWLVVDALQLFSRQTVHGDGAGALYLKKSDGNRALAELKCVTDSNLFTRSQSRAQAARQLRGALPACSADQLLVDGLQNIPRLDAAETGVWREWSGARISPKAILGEGLMAASAWQCVVAIDALREKRYPAASVSVVGCNQQAIGAHFVAAKTGI